MKKIGVVVSLVVSFILILLLAACSGGAESDVVTAVSSGQGGTAVAGRLSESSSGGLSVETQLAVGTLQLESTDLAVDETTAGELLPLWQALLSLAASDTTADVELTAVVNQIQETMDPAQIQAIADMHLTQDSIQTMLQDGTLTFGRGGLGGNRASSDDAAGSGGFSGFPGGGPGGGGPPDGGFPGGGPGGGGIGSDPNTIQTRQAEFASQSGGADFQAMAMTNAVIRLLQEKTGQTPSGTFGLFGSAVTAVSEAAGLSEEDVRAAVSDGQTLAQILEANGGDVEAITSQLVKSLADSPLMQDQDPQELVNDLLNGGQSFSSQPPQE